VKRVAVVGGGVSGLTAAYRLRRLLGDGAEIVVFEKTKTPGGKLRTAELAGVPYDVGAEAFLVRRPEMLGLARELGLDVVHPTKARAKIHAGGAVTGLPPGTVMGVPASAESVAGVLSETGRRAVEAEPSLPALRLPGGDLPLGPLLRERFGDELVDRLVDPLLGGVYAGGADGLGLRATMPGLAAAVAAGAGSLTAAAQAQLPANPSSAPVFGTVPGGLGTLVDRLTELSGAELRTGLPVCEIERHGTGWRLRIGANPTAHAPADNTVEADAVVLAVPAPSARRLLADLVPAASAAFGEVELASMAVVALALPRSRFLGRAVRGEGVHVLFAEVGALRHRPGAGPRFGRALRRAGRVAGGRRRAGPRGPRRPGAPDGRDGGADRDVGDALGRRPAAVRRGPPRARGADREGDRRGAGARGGRGDPARRRAAGVRGHGRSGGAADRRAPLFVSALT
jgi:protoporphyrinogen oxidase